LYVIEIRQHSILFVTKSHNSSITNIFPFDDSFSVLTSGVDADIKLWDINNESPSQIFKKHYSSVDFLNVISIDDRRLSVDNAQVTSVDSSGMVIVWDLSDGSILQIKKIEPNASYLISETQPLKIISSYFKQDKIIAELLDLSTENRIQSIEGFYDVENELGSTPSHMITLQKINSESKKPNFSLPIKIVETFVLPTKGINKYGSPIFTNQEKE